MADYNPNSKLKDYLAGGTENLRALLQTRVISNNHRELDRMERYHLNWKFYDGYHYKDFNHALISVNYIKAFIDKVNLFLLGSKGFSFTVKSLYSDIIEDEIEQPIEELLMYHWKRNNKSITAHEILQMGSVCGDVWIMLSWELVKKYCKITVLKSYEVFPIFKDGDFSKLEGIQVRQSLDKNNGTLSTNQNMLQVTFYTAEKVSNWTQKTSVLVKPKKNIISDEWEGDVIGYTEQPNPLGFIPIVHIKNRPTSNNYFGKSDAHDILKLNKVYDELNQELKGIIDYYATPTTVVTGATLKSMTRGLGSIWSGLPAEANVFTLGLDADLSAMITFLDRLKTAMHEISDVPENVLGKIQAISGTSAAALQLTYLPLVQQADLKALTYGEGFTEVNAMMLQIMTKYDSANPRLKKIPKNYLDGLLAGEYVVEPEFKYGFPADRMQQLQEAQMENQLGILSRKKLANDLGMSNVNAILKAADEDKINAAKVQSQVMQLTTPAVPTTGAKQ